MNRRRIILAIAAILLAGISLAFVLISVRNKQEPGPPQPAEEELEKLRALPYVQWDPNANTKLAGVTRYDKEKASRGFNLFTNDRDKAMLMDMSGKVVHEWLLEGRKHCEYAEMAPDGSLIAACLLDGLVKVDWNSRLLWHAPGRVHHDFAVLPDANILVVAQDEPREYNNYRVIFDSILTITSSGKTIGRWSTFDRVRDLQRTHKQSPLDFPRKGNKIRAEDFDYYHLNTIEVLPDTPLGRHDKRFRAGNLVICSRQLDWIAVLDPSSHDVLWSWGPGIIDGPHMPTMLENGNFLVFDNGPNRGWSRILEIEPPSGRIVWEFKGDPPKSFFSPWRGSNQLLPNGNILICDSENGRAFEITRNGEMVWEFWNPNIVKGKRKRIYRMMRLPEQQVTPLLSILQSGDPLLVSTSEQG